MISNKYKYGLVDLSYVLTRNNFAATKGKAPEDYNPGDVVRMTIQTLNKVARDYGITCDKFIFCRDMWSREHKGYFRSLILKGLYKDSRTYMTEDLYESIKTNPQSSPEEITKAWEELCCNKCKQKAKNILIYELGKFGIPTIGMEGYEADDIITLAASFLYQEDKPSVIITKDSDLKYSINPNVDWFKLPTAGSTPEVIKYDPVYQEMPEILRNHNISIYEYNAVRNALGVSHNDMRKTTKHGVNAEDATVRILINNDYSMIDPEMMETFNNQRSSYNIGIFPNFEELRNQILQQIPTAGQISSYSDFSQFCTKNNISGITERYYTEFINRFDQKLFTK